MCMWLIMTRRLERGLHAWCAQQTTTSCDFTSANEFLKDLGPDAQGCVILDAGILGLPTEVKQVALKSCGARLPIIVVSAHDDPESRQNAKEIGAVGFFRKPVDGTLRFSMLSTGLCDRVAPKRMNSPVESD